MVASIAVRPGAAHGRRSSTPSPSHFAAAGKAALPHHLLSLQAERAGDDRAALAQLIAWFHRRGDVSLLDRQHVWVVVRTGRLLIATGQPHTGASLLQAVVDRHPDQPGVDLARGILRQLGVSGD